MIVSWKLGRAVVVYDSARVSPERMIEAVEAIGFQPVS